MNAIFIFRFRTIEWRSLVKPYLISTIGIGTSATVGDFICQYLERNKQGNMFHPPSSSILPWWDKQRSLVMCVSSTFVVAPWNFTLSRFIENLFPGKWKGIFQYLIQFSVFLSIGKQGGQIVKKMLTNTLLAPLGMSCFCLGNPFKRSVFSRGKHEN